MRYFYCVCVTLMFTLFSAGLAGAEDTGMTHTFVTDTGYYFATSHEGKMGAATDLMDIEVVRNIPYSLGNWRGYELENDDENIVFFRAYRNTEEEEAKIYFIAVHGTTERRFHTAEVCYINDNWKVKKRGYIEVPSAGRNFEARYFTAQKNEWQHLLIYWFNWKDSRRLMSEGCVMFRVSVRMTYIDEEKAKEYAFDFIRNLTGFSSGEVKVSALPYAAGGKGIIEDVMPNPASKYFKTRKKVLDWLNNQMVPNDVVRSPAGDRRNLILSYELPETAEAYKYIFSKSSLYDNGVAVIAFCIERQFEKASKIIDAIMRMGGAEGDLFFTFNTHNSWPNKDDNWGAIIRSGASAWAGQAIVFYLKARMLEDPDIIKKDSEMLSYLDYSKVIADRMLKRSVTDKEDARYGLITGGKGTYRLELNRELEKIEENFLPGEVSWCSIEHNIDMYFFLKDLGMVSGESKYKDAAELLGSRLIAQCWNEEKGQFNRGQSSERYDTVMALDCASWGAIFLFSRGEKDLALRALKAMKKYTSRMDGVTGYKPYGAKPIYETYEVGKFYFPENPKKSWNEADAMWTEGALGAALAYLRAGDKKKAKKIIKDVLKYQVESGGIRYSSLYIPHEFSSEPGVAAAGWLTIVVGILEDDRVANLFWE